MTAIQNASGSDFREGDILGAYFSNSNCGADKGFIQVSIVERHEKLIAVHNRIDLAVRYDVLGAGDNPVFMELEWLENLADKVVLLFRSEEQSS
ncbi:hypothetical protein [Listeria newyorkensis]|uniref:hypothetical protein n=1 Tax=Listeria newyorkensis TaxID=1497681 RepID=UPI00051CF01E|nr:hypothetical protein [Listeria newyorkensis]KGL43643.1 hypothetical protein EP58_07865 [Listeria newyorkensis]